MHGKLTKRVLFVDDEPSIRATLPVILRRYGYELTTAASVAEALEQIHSQQFDVVISDLNIGTAEDGYTVIDAVRQINPRCVTIILTGFPEVESAIKGIHYGIDDYVIKPAGADALVAALAQKLGARGPKACILSFCHDLPLLRTRHMLLEREGYEVISTSDLATTLEECNRRPFDIFIIGHSVPLQDKENIAKAFRHVSQAHIISLSQSSGDVPVEAADLVIDSDPQSLLEAIAKLAGSKMSVLRAEA